MKSIQVKLLKNEIKAVSQQTAVLKKMFRLCSQKEEENKAAHLLKDLEK